MSQSVPVLMYHHVSPAVDRLTVSPARFDEQMTYLVRAGFRSLTAIEFQSFLAGGHRVPARSVLITFDDGYLDNGVYAWPVLARLSLHAVIFAVTGWAGEGPSRVSLREGREGSPVCAWSHNECKAAMAAGERDKVLLRWSEIAQIEASGVVEFHSHSHRHVRWDLEQSDAAKRDALVGQDLQLSRETLRRRLGKTSEHLSWPWGHMEVSYGDLAATAGFKVCYTTRSGANVEGGNPQRVARLSMKNLGRWWFAPMLWIHRHSLSARLYALRNAM